MKAVHCLFAAVALCLFSNVAAAQTTPSPSPAPAPASSGPQIKVGTTIFADATETIAPAAVDAAGQSYRPFGFNLTRAYATVTGSFNPVLSFRVTSDIAREISTGNSLDGSFLVRMKYAYAQINLDQWTGKFSQTWIRFGLTPTPFVEGRDAVYRYRWQGPLMPEREGLISSSDTGISFHTNFPESFGDLQVSVINGEGYQHPEVNSQKAVQGRVTLRPAARAASPLLQALRVTAFYDHDHYMRNADRKRGFYGVSYENGHANAGAEIVRSRDQPLPSADLDKGRGWDVFVTPFFKEKGNGPEALVRYDRWMPDVSKTDQRRRMILGVSYWWTEPGGASAALMLDYEDLTVKNPSTPQPAQRRLALHTVLTF